MACMMKYTKHTDNDNIYNFQDKEYSGASKKVIDGSQRLIGIRYKIILP